MCDIVQYMAENKEKFVVIRIKDSTRIKLNVKAAQEDKPVWEVVEELINNMI